MRKPRKFVNVNVKDLARLTTDNILENKPDRDQTNHGLGTTKVRSASTQKTGWKWYDTQPAASSSSSGWQPSAWSQSSSWSQTSNWDERQFCFTNQGFSLTGNDDALVSDGRGVNTALNPLAQVALPHTCFFSFGSRLESSSQVSCVSRKNIPSSHLAHHVARALVVVSFTLEHYFTFHLHSSPTFHSTIYQTSIDAIFSWRLYLRRSIECVCRSLG